MTTDRDALLAAVIANPDDDLPRLVYADYLDDVGGEANVARAEFIRSEVTAERLPADDPERERLETRAARLFNRFGEAWNAELPGWGTFPYRVGYRRGFPDELSTTSATYLWQMAFAVSPITCVRMHSDLVEDLWPQAVEGQSLSRIRLLQLGPNLRLARASEIERSRELAEGLFQDVCREPTLTGVRWLDLSGNEMNNAMLEVLLRNVRYARFSPILTVLDLSANLLTDAGLAYLAATHGLESLTQVNVRDNPITAAGAEVLRSRFGPGVIA